MRPMAEASPPSTPATGDILMRRRIADGRLAIGVKNSTGWSVRVLDTVAGDPEAEAAIRDSGLAPIDYVVANQGAFLLEETKCPSPAAMRRLIRALVAEGVHETRPVGDLVFLAVGAIFLLAGLASAVVGSLQDWIEPDTLALPLLITGIGFLGVSQILSLLKRLIAKIERL